MCQRWRERTPDEATPEESGSTPASSSTLVFLSHLPFALKRLQHGNLSSLCFQEEPYLRLVHAAAIF